MTLNAGPRDTIRRFTRDGHLSCYDVYSKFCKFWTIKIWDKFLHNCFMCFFCKTLVFSWPKNGFEYWSVCTGSQFLYIHHIEWVFMCHKYTVFRRLFSARFHRDTSYKSGQGKSWNKEVTYTVKMVVFTWTYPLLSYYYFCYRVFFLTIMQGTTENLGKPL